MLHHVVLNLAAHQGSHLSSPVVATLHGSGNRNRTSERSSSLLPSNRTMTAVSSDDKVSPKVVYIHRYILFLCLHLTSIFSTAMLATTEKVHCVLHCGEDLRDLNYITTAVYMSTIQDKFSFTAILKNNSISVI